MALWATLSHAKTPEEGPKRRTGTCAHATSARRASIGVGIIAHIIPLMVPL